MIALCGMVVNGGFVLCVTRNQFLASGFPAQNVTQMAAERRFRPIMLTAITTFLGLLPMIFETSMQGLFLVPMAISLGVGTLVSAVVILILVPAVFHGLEEFGLLNSPSVPPGIKDSKPRNSNQEVPV
jgi:multidrug efflux pump subunit AcrB